MHSLIQPSQPGRHWKVQPDKCCPFCQLASKGSEVDNNWQLDCAIANNVGGGGIRSPWASEVPNRTERKRLTQE